MTTEFADKLKQAIASKKADMNNFEWKGPKVNGLQETILLVNATQEQLNRFYNHCKQMLYNKSLKNPGRLVLLDIVEDQIQRCRAELLVRWLIATQSYPKSKILDTIKTVIHNNESVLTQDTIKTEPISLILGGLPIDYQQVPIALVMDACLDYLGQFDNSHLTLNFIVKMGLWFTPTEMQKDLYRKDPKTGKTENRLLVVADELHLNPSIKLRICATGLTYSEFRAMCKLRHDKYANLTTEQLKLLSNKVLYRFQNQCEEQAKQWQSKMEEIEKVAESKGWDISSNNEQ